MSTKIVLKPIIVPDGDYCWQFDGDNPICEHFDNEGGHNTCDLGYDLDGGITNGGVPKNPKCAKLERYIP